MKYTIEPSQVFLDRYRLLPEHTAQNVDEKVAELLRDPRPIGKTKTAIVGTRDPKRYRLRAGDYRVIYSYEGDTVRIWDVNKRSEAYGRMMAGKFVLMDESKISPNAKNIELQEESETGIDWTVYRDQIRLWLNPHVALEIAEKNATGGSTRLPTRLPNLITWELLARIGIDSSYHDDLIRCLTDEDLILAITYHEVPAHIVDRVFSVVAEPDDAMLTAQPQGFIRNVEDLSRFYGDLLDLQGVLDKEQRELAATISRTSGSWLVRGGPGTGKSALLLASAVFFYQERRRLGEHPEILVTTYTNALVATLGAQLDRLLPGPRPGFTLRTTDSIVNDIIDEAQTSKSLSMPKTSKLLDYLHTAVEEVVEHKKQPTPSGRKPMLKVVSPNGGIQHAPLKGMGWQYLLDEIELVIVGRNIQSLEEYLTEPRHGRRAGLSEPRRKVVWEVAGAFERVLSRRRATTWARKRRRAARLIASGEVTRRYDAVFVDEAQDLQPNAIRMLVDFATAHDGGIERLLLAADMNQTIYGTGISWRSLHTELRIQGRSRTLHTNHRSTKQIIEAAEAYLSGSELEEEKSTIEHRYHGPVPEVIHGMKVEDETDRILDFFHMHTGQIERDVDMCAVLAPTYERCKYIEQAFGARGIPARFMERGNVDTLFPGVKILTRHAAKGIEFPIVALSLVDGVPLIDGDSGEATEAREKERRLNHMAMTRAMRSLLVTLPEDTDPELAAGIAEPLWRIEHVTSG